MKNKAVTMLMLGLAASIILASQGFAQVEKGVPDPPPAFSLDPVDDMIEDDGSSVTVVEESDDADILPSPAAPVTPTVPTPPVTPTVPTPPVTPTVPTPPVTPTEPTPIDSTPIADRMSDAVTPTSTETNAALVTTVTAPTVTSGEEGFIEGPGQQDTSGGTAKADDEGIMRISVSVDGMELVQVAQMFQTLSGADIMFVPSNLVGVVTANITDKPWKVALESILDQHDYILIEKTPDSQIYQIEKRVPGAPEPILPKIIFLKYASVSNIVDVITPMVPSPGTLTTFPSRNVILVRSTEKNIAEVEEIVLEIDILREQVFIETKFLELNHDDQKDVGINWQMLQGFGIGASGLNVDLANNRSWTESRNDADSAWDRRSRLDQVDERYDINGEQYQEATTEVTEQPPSSGNFVTEITLTPTRSVTDSIDTGRNLTTDITEAFSKTFTDVRTAVLSADDMRVILSALNQLDGVTVVSNPKIIVANEEPALIHIGQTERPFVSSVTPGQQGIAPVVTYNPGEPVDFGVKLTVTPTVNTESNITVRIEPELTRFLRDSVAPNGQTYPIIAKKNISTLFCLESGRTAAIGGLTETSDRDVVKKVPLLGSIPLIGKYLFSHSHTERSQQETIIFVTVGIAKPSSIAERSGMPQDARLVPNHLIKDRAERAAYLQQLQKDEQKLDAALDEQARRMQSGLGL